ncbi:MAG: c-type cytochrome [Campylobacterales bacterium]|nr:c-type cytochrome [Campylobacterales bacterium]
MKNAIYFTAALLVLNGCGGGGSSSPVVETNTTQKTNQTQKSDTTPDNNTSQSNQKSDDNATKNEDNASCSSNKYSEDIIQGRTLYIEHCKVCHASDAKSGLFDIRGSRKVDIDTAMEEVPNMIELKLGEQVDDEAREYIALFLQTIKNDPAVEYGNECTSLTKEDLGNKLFFDTNLSLRGTLSCASCHNPASAFVDARFKTEGDTNPVHGALSLGDDGMTLGGRNAPTAMYAKFTPDFTKDSKGEYIGGQFHDGRATNLKAQAKGPILDTTEMMMPDAQMVIERIQQNSEYLSTFKALYGENIFDDIDTAYDALAEAIAKFEKSDTFAPFNSKYDRSKLDSSASNYYAMSELEKQGYALFFDSSKTNCVKCHTLNSRTESNQEIFTNHKYANIGTPKNIAALMVRDGNSDALDLGLGGRSDINDTTLYGKTRIPTLRNIAVTAPYMKNGVFKELRTVLEFHNHISIANDSSNNPETAQPWQSPEINATIDYDLLKMESKLTSEELDALEAFLKTLTDKQFEALVE